MTTPRDYFEHVRQPPSAPLEGPVNAWTTCVGAHLGQQREALCWVDLQRQVRRYTFEELDGWSAQFAHLLVARGLKPGDVVAGLLPRRLELLIVILGTWRAGGVYQPLFTAFGPKSLEHRLSTSGARLVVSARDQRAKLDEIATTAQILTLDADGEEHFWRAMDSLPTAFDPVPLTREDPCMIMFTSGTVGAPKGLMVPLHGLDVMATYMREAVDLRADDTLWNIADPGWAYGLYYGIAGPLALGHSTTFHEGPFTVESCYATIAQLGVTNLMGAPTAYRMLMAAGDAPAAAVKGQLRAVSSAGEPLNPEVIRWFDKALGTLIHDHYGQTETGMTLCNHHALAHPVQAGSAGYPLPGYRLEVLGEDGKPQPVGTPGMLAVHIADSPALFFRGYWQADTQPFKDGWYLTGDTVERNDDGSIAFVGRSDDVITSAGYRIGPFDVESCLLEHPDVVEAGVVGKPDPERLELVKAYVVLRAGAAGSDALATELAQYVKQRLSAHAYPREIAFVNELPKTPSGKIQRFLLRNQAKAELEQASTSPA
ncbi:acetyl-CoA synthetase [Pseudoxanthomonas sp. GM95]|uniref:AMP-binding protein n=1 Tax=Pseudoxanthomonas sp. GM95 TaxID=1881043 RepID=UPI0008B3BB76|nr:AMP-binding protein [Pseudoxanthomonas sp. GM95]SEK55335.1 acetyl-CoA synthetase [Pseudoxanthomonas sp. GM95]